LIDQINVDLTPIILTPFISPQLLFKRGCMAQGRK
jgi:hypothetical protein